jgi:hypothetical protein
MDNHFSKEDTKILKGFAMALMLMHHLWAFPERIAYDGLTCSIEIYDMTLIKYLGIFGRICVSIFMFLGGYGIYKSYEKKGFDLFARLKSLYLSYWKVFIIFIPIGFIFFSDQPIYCDTETICTVFSEFKLDECINNFLGISCTYNGEWWFFLSYIYAILTFPIIVKIMKNRPLASNLWIIVIYSILEANVFPALGKIEVLGTINNNFIYRSLFCQTTPSISCFWMGILMAKEDLLVKTIAKLKQQKALNPIVDIIVIVLTVYLRNTALGSSLDMIYVPILVICVSNLVSFKLLKFLGKGLKHVGNHSTTMWLTHSFLCYYFYPTAKLVVAPKNGFLSYLLLFFISFVLSFVLDDFYKFLSKHIKNIKPPTKLLKKFSKTNHATSKELVENTQ